MSTADRWNPAALGALAGLVAVRLSAGFQFHAVAVTAPLLVASLGLSWTEAGWLIGAYVLPAVLLSIPGGLVVQRYGDRRVLLAALMLAVLGGGLATIACGFLPMLAGRLLAGVGGALIQIIVLKMATERFAGARLSTATATALTSWPLGIALALAVLGAIAQWAGWRAALGVAAAYPLVALLFVWRTTGLFPTSGSGPAVRLRDFAGSQLAGLRPAIGISLAWMLFNAGFSGFVAFAPTWLADIGRSIDRAGAAASLTGWALVAAQPWGGWVVDRTGRPSLVLCTGAVVAAAGIWLSLASAGAEPFYLLVGLAMGLTPGVLGARLSVSARVEQRGLAFGLFATGSGAGSMFGPGLVGISRDLSGSSAVAVGLTGALVLLAILPWWWALRGMRR